MIRNYADHAANERTFLAWVRTAIAVMAFGFLIEKFDLFLVVAAPQLAHLHLARGGTLFGNIADFALILAGTGMTVIATARFLATARDIDTQDMRPGTGAARHGSGGFAGAVGHFVSVLSFADHFFVTLIGRDAPLRVGLQGLGGLSPCDSHRVGWP